MTCSFVVRILILSREVGYLFWVWINSKKNHKRQLHSVTELGEKSQTATVLGNFINHNNTLIGLFGGKCLIDNFKSFFLNIWNACASSIQLHKLPLNDDEWDDTSLSWVLLDLKEKRGFWWQELKHMFWLSQV